MITIKRIKIFGFKSEHRNAEVVFADDSVSVIFGQNGSGKTTFLKIIHYILSQDEGGLVENGIKKISLVMQRDDSLHDVTLEVNPETGEFDWFPLINLGLNDVSSLSLGVERGTSIQTNRIDPRDIMDFLRFPRFRSVFNSMHAITEIAEELALFLRSKTSRLRGRTTNLEFDKKNLYLQNIKIENIEEILLDRYRQARIIASKKIQSALFDTLAVVVDPKYNASANKKSLPENFDQLVLANRQRIIEALDDGSDNQFKNTITNILATTEPEKVIEGIRQNELLSQLILNMMEELEVEQLNLVSINLLIDTFNKYLIDGKKLVISGRDIRIEVDGHKHSVNDLSSGERHILTFLSLVLFQGATRDILIIDEPEISLNIVWQRELLPLFRKLVPNTQIIVASHSPSLAKGNPQWLCELKTTRA